MAAAQAALMSTRQAMDTTRQAWSETRHAAMRVRDALLQAAEEARRAAELARREEAGERLTRTESRELTRDRLLDAAAEVFNRHGYHGASLEAVAEAAGYTKGAVYSNFATKGDLFLALHRRYTVSRIAEQSAAMAGLSAAQLAEQGGTAIIEQARTQERWDLLQIEFWLAAMRDPELRAAMVRDNEQLWTEMGAKFDRTFEREGLTPPFTGTEFAKLINALGSGLVLQLYLDPDFIDASLFARAIRALVGMPVDAVPSGTAPAEPASTPPEPTQAPSAGPPRPAAPERPLAPAPPPAPEPRRAPSG